MPKVKKAPLRNVLDKATCLKRLAAETAPRVTLSFYRYVKIADPVALRDALYKEWEALGILGRIYLAREGINAQLSVPEPQFERFKAALAARPEFAGLFLNIALEHTESFYKLTIKVKKQIVADGLAEDVYDLSAVGKHLSPEEFNAAMEAENALVVDMRNFYESRIGHFEGAVCPDSNTFKEELQMATEALKGQEDKKVLLYCTGGIRCEKASAYFKHHGFKDVNQLQGGIIRYAQEVRAKGLPNKFHGSNYVFDERVSERVSNEVLSQCDQCGAAWDGYVNCANAACNLLFLQCGVCAEKWKGACTPECLAVVELPKEERRAHYANQEPCTQDIYVSRIRPREKIQW